LTWKSLWQSDGVNSLGGAPAMGQKQLWEWSMLTHGHQPHAAGGSWQGRLQKSLPVLTGNSSLRSHLKDTKVCTTLSLWGSV
jgi:hypothetical protein